MRWAASAIRQYRKPLLFGLAALLVAGAVLHGLNASGAQMPNRFVKMSTTDVSASADYKFGFTIRTAGTLGSIVIEICSNSPFPDTPCTAPSGFDFSGAALINQTGVSGFSIDPASTANHLLLTRAPSNTAAGPVTLEFSGVVNPSSPGSYYGRLQTFATADGSGSETDFGGLAFAILNGPLGISAKVPPYLLFCTALVISTFNCSSATGDTIDFGELSYTFASSGTSQMLVATNGKDGYNITLSGTTMTSGTNVIPPITDDVSRPGTAQFGLNLVSNSVPPVGSDAAGPGLALPNPPYNKPDFYNFNSGDILVSVSVPDDIRRFTTSYIVNVPKGQAPGIYVSTVTYICLANF